MSKKLINDPSRVVPELLEGLLRANGGRIVQVGPVGAIAKASIPDGKVAVLIGGGSCIVDPAGRVLAGPARDGEQS